MKKTGSLKDLIKFVDFTHKFNQVKRQILATGEHHNENDSEHSFQLALVAWYLNQSRDLKLNTDKLIKYGLIHDLVEVYAGDTYFHTTNQQQRDSKLQREAKALIKIRKNFAEFPELSDLIEQYEKRADQEAKFIYALDKILPVINIYMDEGKSWQRDKVTYEMVRTKDEKIIVSSKALDIWQEVINLLEQNKELFNN